MTRRGTWTLILPLLSCLTAADPDKPPASVAVVDSAGGSVDFLDAETLAKLGHVRVGIGPREIALSPDGRTAYLPLHGSTTGDREAAPGHQVAAIDLGTRKVTRLIDLKPHVAPRGIVVDADGLLWVTCEREGSLLVIDPKRKDAVIDVVRISGKGTNRVAISPDRTRIYATSPDVPVISVVDAASRVLVKEIRLSHAVDGMAISPDGRFLYACPTVGRSLCVVDAIHARMAREFPLDEPPGIPQISPDGKTLMIPHPGSGTVEVLEAESLRRRGNVRVGAEPSAIVVSPDGKTAYVADTGSSTVTKFEMESLRVLRTVAIGKKPGGLALIGK